MIINPVISFFIYLPIALFLSLDGLRLIMNTESALVPYIRLIVAFIRVHFYFKTFGAEPEIATRELDCR